MFPQYQDTLVTIYNQNCVEKDGAKQQLLVGKCRVKQMGVFF